MSLSCDELNARLNWAAVAPVISISYGVGLGMAGLFASAVAANEGEKKKAGLMKDMGVILIAAGAYTLGWVLSLKVDCAWKSVNR